MAKSVAIAIVVTILLTTALNMLGVYVVVPAASGSKGSGACMGRFIEPLLPGDVLNQGCGLDPNLVDGYWEFVRFMGPNKYQQRSMTLAMDAIERFVLLSDCAQNIACNPTPSWNKGSFNYMPGSMLDASGTNPTFPNLVTKFVAAYPAFTPEFFTAPRTWYRTTGTRITGGQAEKILQVGVRRISNSRLEVLLTFATAISSTVSYIFNNTGSTGDNATLVNEEGLSIFYIDSKTDYVCLPGGVFKAFTNNSGEWDIGLRPRPSKAQAWDMPILPLFGVIKHAPASSPLIQ